jgi:3-deoxy-D-manno-octulosonic-acid transferase
MIIIYRLLINLLLIFSPLIIIYRILINKEDKKRFIEKFSFSSKKEKKEIFIGFMEQALVN